MPSESDIGGIYRSRFWKKNIFRFKYIDLVKSVQIYLVYRYPATSAKHFSFVNTAVDSVVNATLNLARHSVAILKLKEKGRWKIRRKRKYLEVLYHLLTKNCLRVTALTARMTLQTRFPTFLRHNVTMTSIAAVTRRHFPDSTFVSRWKIRDIFFFCIFFIFLSLLIKRPST